MSDDTIESRLEKAKAAFPGRRLYVAESPAGDLIIGKPKRADYLLYRTMADGDDVTDKAKAQDTLLTMCAVDPEPKAIPELLEEYPAIARHPSVGAALLKAIGIIRDEEVKK